MMKNVDIEVKTAELEDIDLEKYTKYAKEGKVDSIENEIAMLDNDLTALGIPSNMIHLPLEQINMLVFMVSSDTFCKYTGKMTLNNVLESFIETFENDKTVNYLLKNAFERKQDLKYNSETGEYEPTGKYYYVKRPQGNKHIIKLRMLAGKFWNENNLKKYMKTARELFVDGGIERNDKFKDMVFEEAMNNEDPQIRARFSSMHSKIEGLDKNKGIQIVNMFEKHGGKEFSEHASEISGNGLFNISNAIDAEISEVGDDDE